ncbi:MAG: pyridoxine 5'-phosphate synthase [Bacteroidetes bacterium]|nr:pyridoxine 5'-phosphate synthase [Bacteroidota bacterium]
MPAKLSVNINKLATIRNARGGNNPDIIQAAKDIQNWGAEGITVHPRPDERHIRYSDVRNLKQVVNTEFNIEGYPDKRFLELIAEIHPEQVTLVPDPPDVLTSNAGWDTIANQTLLQDIISEIKSSGSRVSIFLDANPFMVEGAKKCGADRIELYTEQYASHFHTDAEAAIRNYVFTANEAENAGLGVNAGHDLDLNNLHYFAKNIPQLLEVSIGHALVCDALYYGLQNAVQMYKIRLNPEFGSI